MARSAADPLIVAGPMGKTEVFYFPDAQALARAAAQQVLGFVAGRKKATVCLSGGRITIALFAELVAQSRSHSKGTAEFNDTTDFFWADERCVPIADPESNAGLAQQHLFEPLGIDAGRIHRIPGEADPVFAAQTAEAELCRLAPLNSDGVPMVDLLLLGMGEDGHVASLFPGQVEGPSWKEAVYLPVKGPKPPPNRISLSFRAINAAKEVWVLISGSGKNAAFTRAVAEDSGIPLGRVISERPSTRIFTDLKQG
jgi:6-phosphogluconolactonase